MKIWKVVQWGLIGKYTVVKIKNIKYEFKEIDFHLEYIGKGLEYLG